MTGEGRHSGRRAGSRPWVGRGWGEPQYGVVGRGKAHAISGRKGKGGGSINDHEGCGGGIGHEKCQGEGRIEEIAERQVMQHVTAQWQVGWDFLHVVAGLPCAQGLLQVTACCVPQEVVRFFGQQLDLHSLGELAERPPALLKLIGHVLGHHRHASSLPDFLHSLLQYAKHCGVPMVNPLGETSNMEFYS